MGCPGGMPHVVRLGLVAAMAGSSHVAISFVKMRAGAGGRCQQGGGPGAGVTLAKQHMAPSRVATGSCSWALLLARL